ncbi:hypothetical protein P9027_30380 [Bacillus thuringiensis]|uniref:hypothetical protein n=1 Tax=Bacillus thuringiensis TaxID=1428 RepID=UPI002DB77FD9|nr:hypothetical protein [Bacillus thuringiensis]MEC3226225.1 hypothetical protein [Bacillus thuringiensis]MEC3463575.1 hypothetical protein [Bacillus thuringiensis]MEC3556632.1 hypothetical protein [Bacillus thuringiensis]MED2055676.1 hypothetical protein [Bacillus thuringiensis]
MFVLIRKPVITESGFASLKHNLEKEKQMVLEIYRIAFENFLEKEFTNKFLINKMRERMNAGYDHLYIKLVNREITNNRSLFNFKWMIGETFSKRFWFYIFDRIVIKRKFLTYRGTVRKIVEPFREDEIIQLSMEEIVEEVIYKSAVFKKIINDLEKSNLSVDWEIRQRTEGKYFILFITWGEGNEKNEE